MLSLFLLDRGGSDWDENRAMIVAAKNGNDARQLASERSQGDEDRQVWLNKDVSCKKIGQATRSIKRGIVLIDHRAG